MDISKDVYIRSNANTLMKLGQMKTYKKYGLNQEEIDFIESMIRPMDSSDE